VPTISCHFFGGGQGSKRPAAGKFSAGHGAHWRCPVDGGGVADFKFGTKLADYCFSSQAMFCWQNFQPFFFYIGGPQNAKAHQSASGNRRRCRITGQAQQMPAWAKADPTAKLTIIWASLGGKHSTRRPRLDGRVCRVSRRCLARRLFAPEVGEPCLTKRVQSAGPPPRVIVQNCALLSARSDFAPAARSDRAWRRAF